MINSHRVIHFEFQADNIERAKNFYKKVFDWKIEIAMKKGDDDASMDYWGVITGPDDDLGINGGMYERTPDNKLFNYDCVINVSDIDNAIESIVLNGGKIHMDKMKIPKVGWFAGATDTEGNKFSIMQSGLEELE